MSFNLSPWVLALAILAGCATTKPAPPPPPPPKAETPPQEDPSAQEKVRAAMAREIDPLPVRPVPFPEGTYRAQVEASAAPELQQQDGFIHLKVPLGDVQPMHCYVYSDHLDTGASLKRFLRNVTGKVEVVQLRPAEILPAGIDPLTIVHAVYTADTPAGKQLGMLKVAVRPQRANTLLCFHDQTGYAKSFTRVVRTLAESLTPQGDAEAVPPRYGALSVLRMGTVPVGFERRRTFGGKNGGLVHEVISLVLMPRAAAELVTEDSSEVTITDREGRVELIRFYESSEGEERTDLKVEREAFNSYRYEGLHAGKQVSGEFTSADPQGLPGEELQQAVITGKVVGGERSAQVLQEYDPDIRLEGPAELTVRPREGHPRGIELSVGGMEGVGVVDAHGRIEALELTMGGVKLMQQRVATASHP